jgi:prepilin-type N-terminal cleavage/methylation domain-containing protein
MRVRGGDPARVAPEAAVTPRASRAQRGFTMIEVMVALLLTAVAVMGLLGVYLVETRASSYARHTSEAVFLAQDKFEALRAGAASAASGSDPNINERGVATGMFTRLWTVTPAAGYADVVVTITWSEDGVARQFVLRGRRAT